MKIRIDAIDTLFFKDGKPFSMGEESWANGIFPPAPSVFYGSLRTSYFSNNMSEFNKVNTPDDPTSNLRINKISYYSEDELFPAPADLVTKNSNNDNPDLVKLTLNDKPKNGNFPLPKILEYKGNLPKVERPEEELLISSYSMNKYLSGDFEKITSVKLNKFITIEPKVGIGRSNTTKSAAESMIYRVGMRRLENKSSLSFLLDFEGLNLPERGILKLGGEGKAAKYSLFKDDENLIPKPVISSNIVKLYLLTPAIFENGSLPNFEKPLFKKYNMKLLTAAISGYKSIGGFDIQSNQPKPMYRAVKEGSVFYFSFEGDSNNLVDDFFLASISDFNLNKQGFGITLIGNYK